LHDLITIYHDEDSPKFSLVTSVQITEEKELERESTPGPDGPVKGHPQIKHEAESALDIDPLDIPETPMEKSKDEPGSGEREE
jgi:hypothetical protein